MTNSTVDTAPVVSKKKSVTKQIQSIEPKIADLVNGWLKSYGLRYFLEQEKINSEIDEAFEKAPSKSGGTGTNRPDTKLLLQDSKLGFFPIVIEYKGYKDKLVKLDKENHVENINKDGEPNYKNINQYAVNGAVHYANAILQYTSYTDVIAIGVTGYEDDLGLHIQIGVYYVSRSNYGLGQEVGTYTDLSFLKSESFDNFINKIGELSLTEQELKLIHQKRENKIEDALTKINERLYNNQKNISALSRIHLVAASIMANLGVPNKVTPLEPKDLKSSIEENNTDGEIIIRKISSFLKSKSIPPKKVEQILSSLSLTLLDDALSVPNNGMSLLKEIFIEVVNDLGYFYKIGLDIDFTGKLFNVMFRWLSFAGDDQNDVVLTPRYVALLMAKLAKVNKDSYVWDFATGSGGLLVAAMNLMLQDAKDSIASPDDLITVENRIKTEQILGLEVLPEIHMLAILNMILMGDGSSNILHSNSLKSFDGKYGYGKENEVFPADVFLLNPPYSEAGNGMVFVQKALEMMNKGYASIIIQDSAGSGKATEFNRKILKKNTLVASIKMPIDIFIGKSSVQTSIYVFKVGEKHESEYPVKFIDFRNDGYKRSNRKKAKASINLQNIDNAEERYEEVVNLVKFGSKKLNLLTKNEYIESTISLSGENFGNDWNFDQHKVTSDKPSINDFHKTVSDYFSWEVSQLFKNTDSLKNFLSYSIEEKIKDLEIAYSIEWHEYEIGNLFEIKPTKNYGLTNNDLLSSKGNVPVVSNTSINNGITGYVDLEPTEKGNIITFSDTTTDEAIFYQPNDFVGYSHIQGMHKKFDENIGKLDYLFIVTTFRNAVKGKYNYGSKFNRANAAKEKIQLPTVIKDGKHQISFEFMKKVIEIFDDAYLNILEKYLLNYRSSLSKEILKLT